MSFFKQGNITRFAVLRAVSFNDSRSVGHNIRSNSKQLLNF